MIKDVLMKLKDINTQKLLLMDRYSKYTYLLINTIDKRDLAMRRLKITLRDINMLESIIKNKNDVINYYIDMLQ